MAGDTKRAALLVIDVQNGLFRASTRVFNEKQFLENVNALITRAHAAGAPVFMIQHSADRFLVEGTDDWLVQPDVVRDQREIPVHKKHGDSFEGTDLGEHLARLGIRHVVVSGMVTHGCVKNTVLGALKRGYQVTLVKDAHTSYSKDAAQFVREWNEKLEQKGAGLRAASEVVFQA